MPLIAEIMLAVSVGCVEIRNAMTDQEVDEMDSYQVQHLGTSHCYLKFHEVSDEPELKQE